MAQQRKLAAEMEKIYKKVEEGIADFELRQKKMEEAVNENQREKFKDELKREMKKLQRHRDVIKGWQSTPEIKDKERLAITRRTIEERMELFKDIEKESKTKPHSKQGLQAAEKVDPKVQEKADTITFLRDSIAAIQEALELLESELESLESAATKRRRRGGIGAEGAALQARIQRHKRQLHSLELIMRLLDNDALEAPQVLTLREDIQHYIEHNGEPDFVENEEMYAELDLEELEQGLGSVTTVGTLEEKEAEAHPQQQQAPSPPSQNESPTPADDGNAPAAQAAAKPRRRRKPRTPNSAAHGEDGGVRKTRHSSGGHAPTEAASGHTPPPMAKSVPTTPAYQRHALVDRGLGSLAPVPGPLFPVPLLSPPVKKAWATSTEDRAALVINSATPSPPPPPPSIASLIPPTEVETKQTPPKAVVPSLASISKAVLEGTKTGASEETMRKEESGAEEEEEEEAKGEFWLRPAEAASPLCPRDELMGANRSAETERTLSLLEGASQRLPLGVDQERCRELIWRCPLPTPAYYPQAPLPASHTAAYHNLLQPETLFFLFYYAEGSLAQYLAAKALRDLCWRFHKKYLVWFQRKEDPKEITDLWEVGAYHYFDYEAWQQRLKENFKFEYCYLEDRDLPFPCTY